MRKLLNVAIAVISLMFLSSSVAAAYDISNSTANSTDLECLAKNIFYESGNQPLEGKIAVGMVTINRSQDDKFPNSICGVVKQRTALTVPKTVTTTYMVKTGYFSKEEKTETNTVYNKIVVCQFSWYCSKVPRPKDDDPRWIESKRVAEELLTGGYEAYHPQYGNLKYFHNTFVRPAWHNLKRIVKIGGHVFYANKE